MCSHVFLVIALLSQRGSTLKENQTQLQTLEVKMYAISPLSTLHLSHVIIHKELISYIILKCGRLYYVKK